MPLSTQTITLARGFDILFDQEKAPITTAASAQAWAKAYTDYAVAGGIVAARAKQPILAAALTAAFNPYLGGGGPALFIQALIVFWVGLPVPSQAGTVIAVVPVGSVSSPQPYNATQKQQADGLAQVISAFTIGSVKVQVGPPGPVVPIL